MREIDIVTQCEKLVEKSENRYIHDLITWVDGAEHRAVGCGCSHCKGEAVRSRSILDDELTRVFYDDLGPVEDDKPDFSSTFKLYGFDDPADPMNPFGNLPQKT